MQLVSTWDELLLIKGGKMFRSLTFIAALIVSCDFANAQTASSNADVLSYKGLHLAAHEGDMNALENGVYEVLTIAAVANDPEMVFLALELGNAPHLVTSVYDGTALIAAAHLGHHEVVARLAAGDAPLAHIKTVQILVDAGANKSIGDRDGGTALNHAILRGYEEMTEILK